MINVKSMMSEHGASFPGWAKKPLESALRFLLREKDFVEFENRYGHLYGIECAEQVLAYFQTRCLTDASHLENIPEEGPVVLAANHPIGSLDGLALLKTVAVARPDVKIVANGLLGRLKPLKELFIAVENMGGRASREQIEEIQEHLGNGGALIVFPAGEVSRFGRRGVRDRAWSSGFLRFAIRSGAPVVPMHVRGGNSFFFYLVSLLARPLSTYLLVREMFRQKGKSIEIRIGRPVPAVCLQGKRPRLTELAERFRCHVYLLGQGKQGCIADEETPVARPGSRAMLKTALEACECLGKMHDGKMIYLYRSADSRAVSPILHELGRLRELAFRAVGEGSGRRLDLDRYDRDYCHLVLWDPQVSEIIGAYRFTPTAERVKNKGLEGLYSYSLFNYGAEMTHILERGVELGRSFIQPKYWGKRGLDYLWQGIGAYLARRPECRYLFGPVSVPGDLPEKARDLLISFYRSHFRPESAVAMSRQPYPPTPVAEKIFARDYQKDLISLKSMLSELGCSIPTLYKQYTELCEPGGVQFLDFGIDPKFSGCVDGLVVVDIAAIKPARYQRYIAPYLESERQTANI
jgi:putative hemolysin